MPVLKTTLGNYPVDIPVTPLRVGQVGFGRDGELVGDTGSFSRIMVL